MSTGWSDGDKSSVEIPSSQVCTKLTKIDVKLYFQITMSIYLPISWFPKGNPVGCPLLQAARSSLCSYARCQKRLADIFRTDRWWQKGCPRLDFQIHEDVSFGKRCFVLNFHQIELVSMGFLFSLQNRTSNGKMLHARVCSWMPTQRIKCESFRKPSDLYYNE